MLDTSLLLLLKALLINIIIPLVPGLLLIMALFRDKFQGMILYILSWFLGVWIISHRMFDLQFIHFGIGIKEYLLLIIILTLGIWMRLWNKTLTRSQIKQSLKITKAEHIRESFTTLSTIEKTLTIASLCFIVWFMINSFVHTISFPTFADDSFNNWHKPAVNVMYDGGVHIFGSTGEILWRTTRLGYPIHIPIYKAVIGKFMGGWYDTYVNLFQWIGFLGIILLWYIITFSRTKSIFLSIIPWALICSLPLVFWHVIDGYHELPSTYYTILSMRLLFEYLEKQDRDYIILWSFFLWILSYIKNDGLAIYMPSIGLAFIIVLLIKGQFISFWKGLFSQAQQWISILIGIVLLLIPFSALKLYYWLGLNPTDAAAPGTESSPHREIFSQFSSIFFKENNYNIILILIVLIAIMTYQRFSSKKAKNWNILLLLSVPLILFLLFTGVFLFTENYLWVMNQTTVNRVYTMCFIVILFFSSLIIHEFKTQK